EPGTATKVNTLPNDGMRESNDSGPYANVAAEVGGYRSTPRAQQVPRPYPKCCCEQDESGIRSCKARARDPVAIRPSGVENGDYSKICKKERKMMRQQPAHPSSCLDRVTRPVQQHHESTIKADESLVRLIGSEVT